MTVYTFWGNIDEQTEGASVLNLRSGELPIGKAGDFTDAEYAIFSRICILKPGVVHWTRTDFPWETIHGLVFTATPGSGGGGGPTYSFKSRVSSAADLPSTGNTVDDVYLTVDTSSLWAWDGTEWIAIATFPLLGGAITGSVDGGTSSTTSFTDTADGGLSSTTSWTDVIDGGLSSTVF